MGDMLVKKVIAYQGEPGANSHIACKDVYPDMEPLPCASFEDAFTAIIDGTADLGMIPIENSIAGRVADIHHFLPQAGLHIIGEYFLPIHFQLLAFQDAHRRPCQSRAFYLPAKCCWKPQNRRPAEFSRSIDNFAPI